MVFLRGGARRPQPIIMGFIDASRAEGYEVESLGRVLREQGCRVAADIPGLAPRPPCDSHSQRRSGVRPRAWVGVDLGTARPTEDDSRGSVRTAENDRAGAPQGVAGRLAWVGRPDHEGVGAELGSAAPRVSGPPSPGGQTRWGPARA